MFGIPESSVTPEERKQLSNQLIAVQQLQQSDGWQLFLQTLKSAASSAEASMRTAKDPWTGARSMGAFLSLVELAQWPEREAQAIRNRLGS